MTRSPLLAALALAVVPSLAPAAQDDARPVDEVAYDAILDHLRSKVQSREALHEAYERALPKIEAFIEVFPESRLREAAMFDQAQMLAALGRYERAAASLGRLLQQYPDGQYASSATRMSLSMLIYAGQGERALELLAQLPRETDEQKLFHAMMRVEALRYTFRHDEARAEARRALDELGPERGGPLATILADLELVGTQAPAFEVSRYGRPGETIRLADYRDKVVLLDFWATSCPPCMAELPNVKDAYRKHRRRGFDVIGVSLDTAPGMLDLALKRERIPWPQHFDGREWQTDLARLYGVRSLPRTFLIDERGVIREVGVRGPALEVCVETLLREAERRRAEGGGGGAGD